MGHDMRNSRGPGVRLGMLAMMVATVLAGCALPRGAALQSEVVRESNRETPTFDVVPVTRASVPAISKWPVTGWSGSYHWLGASNQASAATIRPSDRIDLVIWDSQENSLLTAEEQKVVSMQGLVVSRDGTIFVPYVDEVVISGLTADGARREIQQRLSSVLPAAQVQLTMTPGIDNSVDLVGGVANPGTYPLPARNYTILSLLSQGGGVSPALRNPVVRLIRGGATYEIPAKALLRSPSKNITIRGGDHVVVEEDERYFTALGASGSEELVYFDQETITAMEAMSMIGGLNDQRANPKGVLVLREYPARAVRPDGRGPSMPQVVFVLDLTSADGLFAARNFNINPKDTVLVTESPVTAAQTVFGLIGRIFGLTTTVNNSF